MNKTLSLRHCVRCFVGVILAAASLSGTALGQCDPGWIYGTEQGLPGATQAGSSRIINAATIWDPDGAGPESELLVVGGQFTIAGDSLANKLATWDGTTWRPFAAELGGGIDALAVYNGDLIAAGNFLLGNQSIVRWDGSAWQPLGATTTGSITCMAVYNGELVVGGWFTDAGGISANHVARWNGSTWSTLGGGLNGVVYDMTVYNGELIVGGRYYTTGDGLTVNNVARWNGTAWQSLGVGVGGQLTNTVSSVAVFGDTIAVGGDFTTAGGHPANQAARWSAAGGWQAMSGLGTSPVIPVSELAQFGNALIASGGFTGFLGANRVAQWVNGAWQRMGSGFDTGGAAKLIEFRGELVALGNFGNAGGVSVADAARWNGSAWARLGTGVVEEIDALTTFNAQLIAAAHAPATVTNAPTPSVILAWNGLSWQSITQDTDNLATSLAVYNGELIAAGKFTTIGGISASQIARWNGSAWQTVGTGLSGHSANATTTVVDAMVIYNGELIVAGDFTSAGGTQANRIARWNGTAWQPLGAGITNPSAQTAEVFALAVHNNELYAGGTFNTAGSTAVLNIARWDGSAWHDLGLGLNGTVRTLASYNGNLIAGGDFLVSGPVQTMHIGLWNGSAWSGLDSGVAGNSSTVRALAVYNSELYAGGSFTSVGGVSASRIARWNGASWNPLGAGVDSFVRALTVYHGELIPGGAFLKAGGLVSAHWARWTTTQAPWIAQNPAPQTVDVGTTATFNVVPATGYSGLSYQWRRNSTNITDGPAGASPGGGTVSGSATPTLTISSTQLSDAGAYDCVVSNTCDSAVSTPANLDVTGCCPGDFNCNGTLNSQDFFDFLTAFLTNMTSADVNADGTVNSQDYFDFLTAFFAGC